MLFRSAIDHLEEMFPDNFIAIGVHNGDFMAVAEYDTPLGLVAFPSGYVNRMRISRPMAETVEGELTFDLDGTFVYDAKRALQSPVPASIELDAQFIQADSMKIQVNTTTRFSLNQDNSDYRVVHVLIEDNIRGTQANSIAYREEKIYGDWGKGGIYGTSSVQNYLYTHVARGIYPSFEGESGHFPQAISFDETFTHTSVIDVPKKVNTKRNLSLVALLIDGNSKEIINAERIHDLQLSSSSESALEDKQTAFALNGSLLTVSDVVRKVSLSDPTGRILIQTQVTGAASFDLSGFNSGAYLIEVVSENGKSVRAKVYLR